MLFLYKFVANIKKDVCYKFILNEWFKAVLNLRCISPKVRPPPTCHWKFNKLNLHFSDFQSCSNTFPVI